MKLAVSHIAWKPEEDKEALSILKKSGFSGIEVVPGRIVEKQAYEYPEKARAFSLEMEKVGFTLCSMQGIWFGQAGSMFGAERQQLLEYTKKAILFAKAGGIPNLVFGCPKNRVKPPEVSDELAVTFFRELGEFAAANDTCIALEPNPTLYGTNFMTATLEAFEMAKRVGSAGCRVNVDFGTMIANGESAEILRGKMPEISHLHISEPGLAEIEKRDEHRHLAEILRKEGYTGYVSLEMRTQPLEVLEATTQYLAEVFG